VAPALQARLCALLAAASGASGMAGGQALDLGATGRRLDLPALTDMHARKTGALLRASVLMGVACAGERDARLAQACEPALRRYAEHIGLAFQVVDDVLDASADSTTLGKTAGKDARQAKATFVTLLGLHAAQDWAQRLLADALAALDGLPPERRPRAQRLAELARRIVSRSH
uniref:polyprenyl synthetase family protein n=1 Tax=Thiomonas sp. TaxID=2047785 RepID=UPI00258A3B4F